MNLPPGGPTEASWSLLMNYLTHLEFHGDLHALISISFFVHRFLSLYSFSLKIAAGSLEKNLLLSLQIFCPKMTTGKMVQVT